MQRGRGPAGAAASTLNQSQRQLSAGMGVPGRGTRFWQQELPGAWAGLMHLLFFFLLCKAGRCLGVSAGPWQAARACTPSSRGWSLGRAPGAGREQGCREAGSCGNPCCCLSPGTPWHSPTTTSALSTTGKAWGGGGGPWPKTGSVKDPGNVRSPSGPVPLESGHAVPDHWEAEAPLHRHHAERGVRGQAGSRRG